MRASYVLFISPFDYFTWVSSLWPWFTFLCLKFKLSPVHLTSEFWPGKGNKGIKNSFHKNLDVQNKYFFLLVATLLSQHHIGLQLKVCVYYVPAGKMQCVVIFVNHGIGRGQDPRWVFSFQVSCWIQYMKIIFLAFRKNFCMSSSAYL